MVLVSLFKFGDERKKTYLPSDQRLPLQRVFCHNEIFYFKKTLCDILLTRYLDFSVFYEYTNF